MDHRRYYVIGAATGEHGPYSLEELAEAAHNGVVAGSDQVRTALGTNVGTVSKVLGGSGGRQQDIGHDSGGRRRTGPPPVVVLVIVGIIAAIACMVYALRPSDLGAGRGHEQPAPGEPTAVAAPRPPEARPLREAPPALPPDPAPAPTPVPAPAGADPFAGASAHYALRRVRADYQGALVRIHRDSDGKELDFSAQKDGSLDGHAIGAFCGSSLGSVARWYDQGPAHADFSQPVAGSQAHIYDRGMQLLYNHRATMHFKRPDRWMDAAATVGVGTVLVVLTCDEKERFAEFQTVLASAGQGDHAFLRGTYGAAAFDAMNHRVKAMHIDGAPGFDCTQFAKLKLVEAELGQPVEAVTLRLANDSVFEKLRGWNGYISEVVVFPQALSSERLRTAEEALAHHFSIALHH
jgi:hypothetical protein